MGNKKKIISVVGARPNFMKLAPIEKTLRKYSDKISHKIVHTGQHYDYKLSQIFFKDLNLPKPNIYLGVGSSSHAEQTAKVMSKFEKVVLKEKPDLVLLFGDVNSTIACSLVCSKIHYKNETIPVGHVEAGLRSFDKTMPEEINRIITDSLSKFLFVTEKDGVKNLVNEGVDRKKIYLTGNVMIDSLINYRKSFSSSKILGTLKVKKDKFALVTIHRPVNVDIKKNLVKIINILNQTARVILDNGDETKIVFPIHPRTMKMAKKFGLEKQLKNIKNIVLAEPLGFRDFIRLLSDCSFVMTDSGGIQEEATFLRKPCLTLRESFERPETFEIGTNTLCGLNEKLINSKVKEIITGRYKQGKIPKLMDGKASERIVKIILKNI